jgi:signal transduction histidine kinase
LDQREILLKCTAPENVPDVFLDTQQMEQVFFNLLKNAMDAVSNQGKIGVTITVDDTSVAVSILDNGVGIPETLLGRIFDPYVTTQTKGSGLGLMVVRRIVQAHGGTIGWASHEGEGACFTVRLPRAERHVRTLSNGSSSEVS